MYCSSRSSCRCSSFSECRPACAEANNCFAFCLAASFEISCNCPARESRDWGLGQSHASHFFSQIFAVAAAAAVAQCLLAGANYTNLQQSSRAKPRERNLEQSLESEGEKRVSMLTHTCLEIRETTHSWELQGMWELS